MCRAGRWRRERGVVIRWKQSLPAAGCGGTGPVRTGVAHVQRSLLDPLTLFLSFFFLYFHFFFLFSFLFHFFFCIFISFSYFHFFLFLFLIFIFLILFSFLFLIFISFFLFSFLFSYFLFILQNGKKIRKRNEIKKKN